jgi:hypothetical protein
MANYTRRRFLQTGLLGTVMGIRPRPAFTRQGQVRTIAGTGVAGYEAEGQGGLQRSDGALYFCEVDTGRTRRLDLGTER